MNDILDDFDPEFIYPKPIDMQPSIDNALYIIDRIRPEIERGSFMATYRMIRHLERTCYLGAIIEERNKMGVPIILVKPKDQDD